MVVILILATVPRGEPITAGPYTLNKHPLYKAVSLLVLPWIGFLVDTWPGALIRVAMYVGSRMCAPEEEAALSKTFGRAWDDYSRAVRIPRAKGGGSSVRLLANEASMTSTAQHTQRRSRLSRCTRPC